MQQNQPNALQQTKRSKTLRIGIDCRLSGRDHAGIGRYIKHLVEHLLSADKKSTYILFFAESAQQKELLGAKIPPNVELVFAPVSHYSIKEQLALPKLFQNENLDVLHVPHFNVPLFYKGTLVVTIHDLLWHEQKGSAVTTLPSWQYWPKYLMYRLVTQQAVRKAHTIITPSETVKNTVISYYPESEDKIVVTPEAPSPTLLSHSKKTRRKAFSLLYVGSLYPHKNVTIILDALQEDPRYTLNIVSARSIFEERFLHEVSKRSLTDRVYLLGSLKESQLAHEYQSCMALIQPSLSEGFGLTGIEAMSFGTPVVASNIPVFHEVYKRGALYFNPASASSLLRQLKAVHRRKVTLQSRAIKHAKTFSWDELAHKTLSVYRSAANNS